MIPMMRMTSDTMMLGRAEEILEAYSENCVIPM
jgi:hypothetical protein